MSKPFTKVGLTAKLHLEKKDELLRPVVDVLVACGSTVFIDAHTVGGIECTKTFKPITNARELDLIIAVGGDGTILRTIRELQPENVPILAINAGSVGFLSELPLSDVAEKLPALLKGDVMLERRTCLSAVVVRESKTLFECQALNDVVISQGTISRLLDLRASVDGHFLANYHADGLIVSTPTGSTAYSLAAGGPVVHPVVPALILTPINPHSFTQKPIVVPGEVPIEVTIEAGDTPAFTGATVGMTVDGQVYQELKTGDKVTVRTGITLQFVRTNKDAFYRALRTKLKWGEGLEN